MSLSSQAIPRSPARFSSENGVDASVENSCARKTLTRETLRDAVNRTCPKLSRAIAHRLVDEFLAEIVDALANGEAVQLNSFGSFKPRSKGARVGRNPRTGVEAKISSRKVIRFTPSQLLIAAIAQRL